MPSRNLIKIDIKDGYYHIYNRGVEKRIIFEEETDYKVMLNYLKEFLSPPVEIGKVIQKFSLRGSTFQGIPHIHKNYFGKIDLLAYCLMPNHFHLLIKQNELGMMQSFMRALSTAYAMYFNKKNGRVGPLFQGTYKAAIITTDEYLIYLSRYIHINPRKYSNNLVSAYSSYGDYIGVRNTTWVKSGEILSFFNESKNGMVRHISTYKDFVEETKINDRDILSDLVLE